MPLKCLYEGEPILSVAMTRDDFEILRREQDRRSHLRFACCDARVGLRVSKTGLQHFYHFGEHGPCRFAGEGDAHLGLKYAAMLAARAAGWEADCEVFSMPGEPRWVADVLATRGKARIAIEAQLANVAWGEIVARQQRYRDAGIRGLWLLGQENYPVSKDVPAFQVRSDEDGCWHVLISPPKDPHNVCVQKYRGHWATLETFINAALTGNLVWSPVRVLDRVDAIIRATPEIRCQCGERLLLPTSLTVSLEYPGHRNLLWTIDLYQQRRANPAPEWLNALVAIFNKDPHRSGGLLATRHTQGRARHFYRCPVCGREIDDIATRRNEISIQRTDLPVKGFLPEAREATAESQFLNQWWLRMPSERKAPEPKQLGLDF